jgi:thioredoxin reductase (NADPH)
MKTLVIGKHDSALLKAEKIENYYGFEMPVSGRSLLEAGEKQALRLGAEIASDEAVGIDKAEHFTVYCVNGEYNGRTVLLAPGAPAVKAPIKGIDAFEGKGVSYCTTCDGFFYRNRRVGVLGYADYAVHEAMELLSFTRDITLYTNGMELNISPASTEQMNAFRVNTKKIKGLYGGESLEGINFEDGTTEDVDGLFVAYGSASGVNFAMKMGIMMNGNSIAFNEKMETNIEGLYTAGDCTGVFKQISVAVGQGAIAARGMIDYVRKQKNIRK